jgi:hypothetical protein
LQLIPQLVPSHVATPLAGTAHAVHELPQFAVLVLLTHAPAQLWKPALQEMPHTPAVHVAEPLAGTVHTMPHALQLVGSELMLISQPSLASPLQSRYPALHVYPHAPDEHVVAAFARAGQMFVQLPQWFASVSPLISQPFRSVVLPSQSR